MSPTLRLPAWLLAEDETFEILVCPKRRGTPFTVVIYDGKGRPFPGGGVTVADAAKAARVKRNAAYQKEGR